MAEIDPVVLRLMIERGTFLADINNYARVVDNQFGRMERDAIALERHMQRSLSGISTAFKSAASSLAVGLSVNQVADFADSFTRVQNSLRVAGLEGRTLESVQADLLSQSSQYGVSLESLADLFGNAAQSGKELGASQQDIVDITKATSQALLITGKNSEQAAGAILGLTQAFNKGKLSAEEWQQINEGGLRPLLQAAAATERFGGSVAKFQAAAYDGKVSSKQFFDAILSGAAVLDQQASKATLTLSGALEALNSRLVVYVGQADKALGASARAAEAIRLLGDNIEPIVSALAVIATFIGTRYVASMGLAAGATLAKAAADVRATQSAAALAAMQARLNPLLLGSAASANVAAASVTRLSVAGGVAARGFGVLVAALGGPVGIALTALAAGIAYATLKSRESLQPTKAYADAQRDAAASADATAKSLDKLAFAHGKERDQMLSAMRVRREAIKEKLNEARVNLALAKSELDAAQSAFRLAAERDKVAAKDPRLSTGIDKSGARNRLEQAAVNVNSQAKALDSRAKELDSITAGINSPAYTRPAATADDDKKKKKGRSGPTADEITARYSNDLRQIVARDLQARLALVTNADDRAELESRMLNDEVRSAADDINATKEYSAARKKKLLAELAEYEASERRRIDVERQEQNAKDAADIAASERTSARDVLEAQSRLAEGRLERRDIEMRLLDLAYEQEKAELEAVLASQTASDAQKQIAEARLRVLDQLKGLDQTGVNRDSESPLEQRRRQVRETAANMGDAVENIELNAIDRLTDGLADASTEFVKLGGVAGDVLNSIIRDMIRLAAQQAIFGSAGGGGGLLGSIGSLFGIAGARAGGGPVAAGKTYLVGEEGPELFTAPASGTIVPNNMLDTSAARSMTGVSAVAPAAMPMSGTIRVALMMDNDVFTARVQEASVPVAVEVYKANAPGMIQAAKADTLRDLGRTRM